MSESLCGVWVNDSGVVHLSVATADGLRVTRTETLRPFAWLNEQVSATTDGVAIEPLKGEGPFNRLAHAESLDTFDDFVKVAKETGGVDVVRPLESQFLLQKRRRLFRDLGFHELRRCQLDIETASSDGEFSDAVKAAVAGPVARTVSQRAPSATRETEIGNGEKPGCSTMTNWPGRAASGGSSTGSTQSVVVSAVSGAVARRVAGVTSDALLSR